MSIYRHISINVQEEAEFELLVDECQECRGRHSPTSDTPEP